MEWNEIATFISWARTLPFLDKLRWKSSQDARTLQELKQKIKRKRSVSAL
jgi:hypothetical protein